MKRFYNIFFEAEGAQVSEGTEQETITEGIEDIVGSKTGMSDILKDAPLIKPEEVAEEPVVLPEENKKLATPKPDDPAVTPSADDKTEEGDNDEGKPKVIQIGGIEKTEQEWLQAEKDSQNKSTWESKLKKINQIERFVDGDEDKLLNLALFATGRKELPENYMEAVELPEVIQLPDGDGVLQDFETKDLPSDVVKALQDQALREMLPNTVNLAEENAQLKEKLEQFDKESEEAGILYVENFVNKHDTLKIPQEEGQSFRDALVEILELPEHPAYAQAFRVKTIMKVSQDENISMEEANKRLFGKADATKKVNDQIRENQTGTPSHIKPTESAPVTTDTDTFIKNMGDSKASKLRELGI